MLRSLQKLSSNEWYRPGTCLWLLSSPDVSYWTSLIDWYLGFRLHHLRHSHWNLKNDPQTQKLIKSYPQFSPPLIPTFNEEKALLIGSSKRLPNLFTIEIPYHPLWLKDTYQIWKNMGQFSLRVFLPKPVFEHDFISLWNPVAKTSQIEYLRAIN